MPRLSSAAGSFAAELQQTTVETNTQVVRTLDDLRRSLVALRAELIRACEPLGIGVAAAGTMPLPVPITITENARFQRMLADYQVLVREQLICGLQVHVGIGDPDLARRADRPGGALVAAAAGAVRQLAVLARRARHRLRQHANADLVALADHRLCGRRSTAPPNTIGWSRI